MTPWFSAHRDAALAVVGATTGLAAVLLVFVGFLLSAAASFPPGTDKKIPRGYVRLAQWGMLPVTLCVVVLLSAFSWVFHPESIWLLKIWAVGFPVVGWTFLVYAAIAVFRE